MVLPKPQPAPHPLRRAFTSLLSAPTDPPAACPTVQVEKVGRGNAGKSALEWAFAKVVVSNFLPSGLQLDVENPQLVAELLDRDRAVRSRLDSDPLLPTTEAAPIRYLLYEGERPRLAFASHEVIGQVLTRTTTKSPPEWQAKYREYVGRLAAARVLWAVLPVPPARPSAAEREQFENDLKVTVGYVREAVKLRPAGPPVDVAMVLTRADTRYDDPDSARRELTDEAVADALTPLVTLARMSDRVGAAAAFVTSAYGFGAAVRKADAAGPRPPEPGAGPQDGQWVLRPDAHVVPFNLLALAAWTLARGLAGLEVAADDPAAGGLARVLGLLESDLDRCGGWVVPIKPAADGRA